MASDIVDKAYAEAVEAFHAAEPRWRKRMLEPGLSRADAERETAEIQQLFEAMQGGFEAFLTSHLPKA